MLLSVTITWSLLNRLNSQRLPVEPFIVTLFRISIFISPLMNSLKYLPTTFVSQTLFVQAQKVQSVDNFLIQSSLNLVIFTRNKQVFNRIKKRINIFFFIVKVIKIFLWIVINGAIYYWPSP